MALVFISDDVPSDAATPAAEGSWAGSRHPIHGSALYLVGGGVPGSLAAHIRALKSPLLLLLLLPNSSVSTPPPPGRKEWDDCPILHDALPICRKEWDRSCPIITLVVARVRVDYSKSNIAAVSQNGCPPLPPPPPPPTIPCPALCGGTPICPSDNQASCVDGRRLPDIGGLLG